MKPAHIPQTPLFGVRQSCWRFSLPCPALLSDHAATARHFERSKPMVFLPGSLLRAGRLAQREISLRSRDSSLRFSVSSASLRYPFAFFSQTRHSSLVTRYFLTWAIQ